MHLLTIIFLFASALSTSEIQCKKEKDKQKGCFKGRLEIKGICLNYVIKALEGDTLPSKIETSWKDPETGKSYENVFALGNPCSFPAEIEEGDEFYFTLVEDDKLKECIVCMAYRPVPDKKNIIKVLKTSCR